LEEKKPTGIPLVTASEEGKAQSLNLIFFNKGLELWSFD